MGRVFGGAASFHNDYVLQELCSDYCKLSVLQSSYLGGFLLCGTFGRRQIVRR